MPQTGNRGLFPAHRMRGGQVAYRVKWAVGATGAVGTVTVEGVAGTTGSALGITVARTGAGAYTVTVPAALQTDAHVSLYQAAGVANSFASIRDATAAGVITVQSYLAGAAADPANGDAVCVFVTQRWSGTN